MNLGHSLKIVALVALSLVLVSCSALSGNGISVQPTANATEIESTMVMLKTQAYEVISAQFTQTAAAIPSETPAPTLAPVTATPMPPTPTAVFTATPYPTFVMPTTVPTLPPAPIASATTVSITATSSAYACKIVSQTPYIGQNVSPNYDFDMHWVVKNTGVKTWEKDNIDYKYISGTKFQKYADGIDFPSTVKTNEQIDLVVDMKAPGSVGSYFATWQIIQGGTVICTLNIDINVK